MRRCGTVEVDRDSLEEVRLSVAEAKVRLARMGRKLTGQRIATLALLSLADADEVPLRRVLQRTDPEVAA